MSTNESLATLLPEPVQVALTKARVAEHKPQGGRPTILTEEVHSTIVLRARTGVFKWVAAAAAGIPYSTFQKWMVRGQKEWEAYEAEVEAYEAAHDVDAEAPLPSQHAALWYDVERACALARAGAEAAVMKEAPHIWLMKGPGRHQPGGKDGWTDKVELSGNVGITPTYLPLGDLSKLTDEQLEQLEGIHATLLDGTGVTPPALPRTGGEG